MKHFLLSATLVACTFGCTNNNSYKISGTVDNSMDGDTVYLQKISGRELVKADSAIIKNGKFTFEGKQDSTVNQYITYAKDGANKYLTDLMVENGQITVSLGNESSISGTANNNIYQEYKNKMSVLRKEQQALYISMQNASLTAEERDAIIAELNSQEDEMTEIVTQTIKDNIQNPVGIHLFTMYNYSMEPEEISELLKSIPERYLKNEQIVQVGEYVESVNRVAVGNQYIDLNMQDPEGNATKLSDFIGNNKYTLIDFWASWCGPCRGEMPVLVEQYKKYKNKGFEIVGISFDRELNAWKEGIKALNITWPQMSDLKMWESAGAKEYAVRGIPFTVLIDQQGTIVAKGIRGEELVDKLAELFN